ncbi:Na-translocating system protein MpsC family protein [Priestia megaterium]|uniref:Na-translocating system protein MpsC family protein n=1 Tax=Priestia megaterium TaxID=1404 RepID=UPI0026E2D00B|nr:Na-translocating system protein MpsC family protein [Priestia megaterium]MDO6849634.1 Na-translocating system protein MpsC family protein [Priestia megaterium]
MEPISKKKIATLYTQISQEVFNAGVSTQKIDIIDNKILILAQSKRMPALDALSEEYKELVMSLDAALSTKYKKMLKQKVELLFDIQVTSLFRDYDPATENSCTVICFR